MIVVTYRTSAWKRSETPVPILLVGYLIITCRLRPSWWLRIANDCSIRSFVPKVCCNCCSCCCRDPICCWIWEMVWSCCGLTEDWIESPWIWEPRFWVPLDGETIPAETPTWPAEGEEDPCWPLVRREMGELVFSEIGDPRSLMRASRVLELKTL